MIVGPTADPVGNTRFRARLRASTASLPSFNAIRGLNFLPRGVLARSALAAVVLVTGFFFGLGFTSPISAAAYNLEGCSWPGDFIYYYIYAPALPYATPIDNAANSWTDTPTEINLLRTTGGSYNILANAYNFGNSGFDGETSYSCSGGYFSGTVQTVLNTYYVSGYSSTARQQVQAHEFGHSLGLAHNNSTCYVLMYYSSYRYFSCGIYSPQQDDVNGINAIYP